MWWWFGLSSILSFALTSDNVGVVSAFTRNSLRSEIPFPNIVVTKNRFLSPPASFVPDHFRTPTLLRDTDQEDRDVDSKSWSELAENEKEAYTVLGYNESLWDGDGVPASEDKDWEKLSPAEQAAADTLGFDQEAWDDDSWNDPPGDFENLNWEELSPEARDAAKTLGYDTKTWDSDDDDDVACAGKEWKKLTATERKAATVLGFSKADWDES